MENKNVLPVLYGEKVVLRPITRDDTGLIVKWRNTKAVRDNFIFQEPFTPEMHYHWLDTKVKSGEVVQYIIEEKQSNTAIGSVYFRDIDKVNRSAEYGIFIGETQARGMGYGSETAKLFCEYGFSVLHLHRISLRVLSGNEQALHSYINAGFHIEGNFKDMVYLQEKWRDVIFMARLEQECE